jgi:hypothetical protein
MKGAKEMSAKTFASAVLSACVVGLCAISLQPFKSSTALAQNPNNLQVSFREYNSTLNYNRAQGNCQVVSSSREVVQTLPCRQSWTQIAYAGRRILFYRLLIIPKRTLPKAVRPTILCLIP